MSSSYKVHVVAFILVIGVGSIVFWVTALAFKSRMKWAHNVAPSYRISDDLLLPCIKYIPELLHIFKALGSSTPSSIYYSSVCSGNRVHDVLKLFTLMHMMCTVVRQLSACPNTAAWLNKNPHIYLPYLANLVNVYVLSMWVFTNTHRGKTLVYGQTIPELGQSNCNL